MNILQVAQVAQLPWYYSGELITMQKKLLQVYWFSVNRIFGLLL